MSDGAWASNLLWNSLLPGVLLFDGTSCFSQSMPEPSRNTSGTGFCLPWVSLKDNCCFRAYMGSGCFAAQSSSFSVLPSSLSYAAVEAALWSTVFTSSATSQALHLMYLFNTILAPENIVWLKKLTFKSSFSFKYLKKYFYSKYGLHANVLNNNFDTEVSVLMVYNLLALLFMRV